MVNRPKLPNSLGEYCCSKCNTYKRPEQFNKNRRQTSGLNYMCKECSKKHVRKYNLPSKYGISVDTYKSMLQDQDNKCACCGVEFGEATACVDHNHRNGEVRSLLCHRCNLAAGNVGDSSERALQLAEYLKKWNC